MSRSHSAVELLSATESINWLELIMVSEHVSDALFTTLFGYEEYHTHPAFSAESSEVICGTTWGKGGIAFRCMDCEKDHNCVICLDCYFAGEHLHLNHRVKLIRTTGGCCDCGDISSWNESGCCPRHGPNRALKSAKVAMADNDRSILTQNALIMFPNLVKTATRAMTSDVDVSVVLSILEFLLETVRNPFFEPLVLSCFEGETISVWIQVCCVLAGRNPRPQPPVMSVPSLEECMSISSTIVDFFLTLVQRNSEFKKAFTKVYISHYGSIVQYRGLEGSDEPQHSDLSSLSVQLFTIPEVCESLLLPDDDQNILTVLIGNLLSLVNSVKDPNGKFVVRKHHVDIMLWRVIHDLGYCLHHDSVCEYLLTNRRLLGMLIDCLKPLHHANVQTIKHGEHVMYENVLWRNIFMYENLLLSTIAPLTEYARTHERAEELVRVILADLESFFPLALAGENGSFHFPIIRILIDSISIESLVDSPESVPPWISEVFSKDLLRQILLECMRPLFLVQEVENDIWVRNGEVMRIQAGEFQSAEQTAVTGIAFALILFNKIISSGDAAIEFFRALAVLIADIPDDFTDETVLVRDRIAFFGSDSEAFALDTLDAWIQLFIRDTIIGGRGNPVDFSRRRTMVGFMCDLLCRLTTDASFVHMSQLNKKVREEKLRKDLLKRCLVQRMHGQRLTYSQILGLVPSALRQPEILVDKVLEQITTKDMSASGMFKLNADGLKLVDCCHRTFSSDYHSIEDLVIKNPCILCDAPADKKDPITEALIASFMGGKGLVLRTISGLIRARLCEQLSPGCLDAVGYPPPELTPQGLDSLAMLFCFKMVDNISHSVSGRKALTTVSEADPVWKRPVFGILMELTALVQRPDLNGMKGVYFGQQDGRYCVTMHHHGKLLAKESTSIQLTTVAPETAFAKSLLGLFEEISEVPASETSEICSQTAKALLQRLSESTGVVSSRGSPESSAVLLGQSAEELSKQKLERAKKRQAMLMQRMKNKQNRFESNEDAHMEPDQTMQDIECAMCRESDHGPQDPLVAIGFCASGNSIARSSPAISCIASPDSPYVNACLHTVHRSCWEHHIEASSGRNVGGDILFQGRASEGEIICPVCRSLANITIPVISSGSESISEETLRAIVDLGEELLQRTRSSSGSEPSSDLWLNRNFPCWRPCVFAPFLDALVETAYNELILSSSLSPSKILSPTALHSLLVRCLRVIAARNVRSVTDWHIWKHDLQEAARVDCGRLFLESGCFSDKTFMKQVLALRHWQLSQSSNTDQTVETEIADLALLMAWIFSAVTDLPHSDLNRLAFLPEDRKSQIATIEQVLGIGDWIATVPSICEALDAKVPRPIAVPRPMGQLLKVNLPENLTDLIKATIGRTCKACGTAPSDPAVCLLCNEVLCLDTECCKTDSDEGECTRHAKVCGSGQGMFILPYASVVVAVGYPRNCIWEGPYVDSHGEPDSYLKRSCQLKLSHHRLDQMRLSYTRGAIPIEIVKQNQITGRYVPRQL